jgi:hypothetical protein
MIKSGIYTKLINAPSIQALLPSDTSSPPNSLASQCVHFTRAPKKPLTPYIVVHLPDVPPAEATLDGVTEQILGMIQFDCYADDDKSNGNGALVANQLSIAVRDLLKNFSGTLSDGTVISFCDVLAHFDDGYEEGGTSFLFRWVLRLQAFYTEGPNTF